MKAFPFSCFAVSLLLCSPLSFADWINTAVEKNEAQTIQLRHHIHQHPELGNMEFETSKLVQQQLKSYGIEVKTGFAKTGVIGILKGAKSGPTMALRADMDALPIEEKRSLLLPVKRKPCIKAKKFRSCMPVDMTHIPLCCWVRPKY